jgi:hypothetical protein
MRILALAGAVLLLAGCVTTLVPAPGAVVVPGPGQGAAARADGVQVVVRFGAWNGRPLNLESVVTPVLVVIDNAGAVPLRIRHEEFALVSADGRTFAARPPFAVEGVVWDTPPAGYALPRASFGFGFGVGRRIGPGGWGLGLGYPFYDPFFYDDYYYPLQIPVRLPTPDMVQLALPESVVEAGARASGFVYFERVRDVDQVDFTARLVDARSGQPIGTARIPFVAR